MYRPPNIHDAIEGFVLLRQALEVLEAPESEQQGLCPSDRDAAAEMTALFDGAWARVQGTAQAVLPREAIAALEALDAALQAPDVDWDDVRRRARLAGDRLPSPERRHAPRPWHEQLVPGPNHLLHRRQVDAEVEADV